MDRCGLCGAEVEMLNCEHFIVEHKRTPDEAIVLVNRFVLGEDSAKFVEDSIREWRERISKRMREKQDEIAAEILHVGFKNK